MRLASLCMYVQCMYVQASDVGCVASDASLNIFEFSYIWVSLGPSNAICRRKKKKVINPTMLELSYAFDNEFFFFLCGGVGDSGMQ